MNLTVEAVELLKTLEGCKLEAYPDPISGGEPWTIGYGCTDGVKPGMKITADQAAEILASKLFKLSPQVREAVSPSLTDNQFGAAVIFAFNMRNWSSTPLFRFLKQGDLKTAAGHWLLYDKGTGPDGQKKEVPGLKERREAELNLFLKA